MDSLKGGEQGYAIEFYGGKKMGMVPIVVPIVVYIIISAGLAIFFQVYLLDLH